MPLPDSDPSVYFTAMKMLVLLFLLMPTLLLAQVDSVRLSEASSLFEEKKYKPALLLLNKLIERSPREAVYYDLRGSVQFELDERQAAAEDFTRAIALKSDEPLYYHHRSMVFYATQNPEKAVADGSAALQYIVDNDSLKYVVLLNRGSAQAMQRNFQQAYNDYMEVLRFDSTSFGALNNIGAVLDELGREEESLAYLKKVVQLYPKFIGGYLNLAFRYAQNNDYVQALALNNKAVSIDPAEPLAYNNRDYVKYKMNDLAGALKDINTSLKLYPGNSYAYRNRALVYLAQKQTEKACMDLQQAETAGFTDMYGDEVEELIKKHCLKK